MFSSVSFGFAMVHSFLLENASVCFQWFERKESGAIGRSGFL